MVGVGVVVKDSVEKIRGGHRQFCNRSERRFVNDHEARLIKSNERTLSKTQISE